MVLDIIKAFVLVMVVMYAMKLAYDIGYLDMEVDKPWQILNDKEKAVESKTEEL